MLLLCIDIENISGIIDLSGAHGLHIGPNSSFYKPNLHLLILFMLDHEPDVTLMPYFIDKFNQGALLE